MSPTPSSVVPPVVSIVPYPFPPPPSVATLGDSSPTAIIVAWVLTAFLPIPLIVLVVLLRYSPDTLPIWLSQSPFPRWWQGKKPLSSSSSSGRTNATPSSWTLTVSNRTSRTLNAANHGTSTPTRDGISVRGSLSPGTPQNSIETSYESPETPSESKISSNSIDSPSKPMENQSKALNPLPSCFESPKRLDFLELRGIPITPRKKPITPLSVNSNPCQLPLVDAPATPHTLQRRRLKYRLLTSAVLCLFIFSMYVLEGFAIAAAQTFAHVRVLSHSDGKEGLGEGKENEKWLIPWVIYIFLQGGMVVGCAWMVWLLRRDLMTMDREWKSEKGKAVERPDVIVLQGRTSRGSNTNAEEERFLPDNEADVSGDLANSAAKVEPEEQESEWQTLGYHPTFDSSSNRPDTTDSTPIFQQFYQHERPDPNLNGEGSSRDFSSRGCSSSAPFPSSSLPTSFLPEKANPWSAERSHAEISLQRKNKEASKWSWPSATTNANESPSAEDQTALLQSSLFGPDIPASERRNSWAMEHSSFSSSSSSEENPPTNKRKKGKAKAKNKRPKEEAEDPEEIELTPTLPRSFLTGINLSQPYHFSDGLAYPLLPIAPRKPKHNPPPPLPPPPNSHDENTTPHTPPFSLPLPPRLLNHPAIAGAPTRFPYTPASSSPRSTIVSPSSRAAHHSNILFPPSPPASSSPYRPSALSPKRPRRPYLPPLRRAFVSPTPSPPQQVYTPTSALPHTYAPPVSSPSPPPLASPLSSPFPVFPSPKSKHQKQEKEQGKQHQPGHCIPTQTQTQSPGLTGSFNSPGSGSFGSPRGGFVAEPGFTESGSPRRVLRSLSARGRTGGMGMGKKQRHVYRRIEGSGLGTVREMEGGLMDGDDGEEGEGGR